MASFSETWSDSFGQLNSNQAQFFGTTVRQDWLPVTPNDLINTEPDGKMISTDWSMKFSGTYDAPLGSASRRSCASSPGRTSVARFWRAQLRQRPHLAEPMDTRRQDNIAVFDTRVEKACSSSPARPCRCSWMSTTSPTRTRIRT